MPKHLKLKGVNYDVGVFPYGEMRPSRPHLDPETVRRELEIIKNEMHCNAVRISGRDIDRLALATRYALEQGLQVWFTPVFHEATPQQTMLYLAECADAAEKLRQGNRDIVFVTGCELTFFMKGLVSGDTSQERMRTFTRPWRLLLSSVSRGSFNKRLNKFLADATMEVHRHFKGPVTYASGMWEDVDWAPFDFVSVDCYRDRFNRRVFRKNLGKYLDSGKPVVASEFGYCTYKGAEEKGGYGFAIVDWDKDPPQLKGRPVRDEEGQAAVLTEMLQIFEEERFSGAFAFTFVMPKYPYSKDTQLDLDMASFALVRTLPNGEGTRYPGVHWEPKQSFYALTEYYANH